MSASPVQASPDMASEKAPAALVELTTVSSPARLKKPMPAGSSRVWHSSDQSDWPSETRSAGLAMPAPSSVTVIMQASPICSVVTATKVAPARRAFWNSSLKMSSRVPLNMRVTLEIACGETRARSFV